MTAPVLAIPNPLLLMSADQLGVLIAFAAAIALLGVFDIALPRGDVLGVGGALDVVALLVAGPVLAVVSCALGGTFALFIRARGAQRSEHAAALAARVLSLVLVAIVMSWVKTRVAPGRWGWPADTVTVASYLVLGVVVSQWLMAWRRGRDAGRAIRGNLDRQLPLLFSQCSIALLAVVVYPSLSAWGLVLVVALLLLIRQSYAMLLEIRETYRVTVEVLVEAAEGQDPQFQGHAERTAQISRSIAARCSMSPNDVVRVSYAALLHDVGRIGSAFGSGATADSSRIIEGVEFFSDVIDLVRICDHGKVPEHVNEDDLLGAFVVLLSSEIDCLANDVPAADGKRLQLLSRAMPAHLKAKAVGVALALGYPTPAVS